MIGDNVTRYSVIHKDGTEIHYVWSQEQRKMVETKMTEKLTAVIYSNGSQECERMSMLLKSLGGEFHEYFLGIDFSDKQFRMEFGSEATYPQVSLGNEHIGNMKEALQHMKEQGLFV